MTLKVSANKSQLHQYSVQGLLHPVATLFWFPTFPYLFILLLLGSATVVWVCLRTRDFRFPPWIYCAVVDPHFRPSSAHPFHLQFSSLLSPHPLSKHNDPAMCSWLSLLPLSFPVTLPDLPHSRKKAAPAPGPVRAVLTALMTRDHKHYFPAAAKTPSHFHSGSSATNTWLEQQWLLGFLQETGLTVLSQSTCSQRYKK